MPLPLLLGPVIATGARYVLGAVAVSAGGEYVQRKARAYFDQYCDDFFAAAVGDMGLELSPDGNLTDESITAVINSKLLAGSGVQLDSLLDRDRLRAGLEKTAVQNLAGAVGLPPGTPATVGGIKSALQVWAGEQVAQQLANEAGPVFDGAPGSAFVGRVVAESVKVPGWNVATDMTDKGIKNRARQTKFRRTHKRTWIEK